VRLVPDEVWAAIQPLRRPSSLIQGRPALDRGPDGAERDHRCAAGQTTL